MADSKKLDALARELTSLRDVSSVFTIERAQAMLQRLAARAPTTPAAPLCPRGCIDGWMFTEDDQGVRRASRCACAAVERTLANVPAELRRVGLRDLDRDHANALAIGAAERFAATKDRDLLLLGACGTGKTTIAVAAANERLWAGDNAHFVRFSAFLQTQLRSIHTQANSESRAAAERSRARVESADPLVVDDLAAAEKDSDYTRRTLLEILDERNARGLRTIFTSNASLRQLGSRYDDRVMSRLLRPDMVFEISGPDRRSERRRDAPVRLRGVRG